MSSIDDFKHLLVQSKKEIDGQPELPPPLEMKEIKAVAGGASRFKEILAKIEAILTGFDEAKTSIKSVSSKNRQIKSLLEQMEKDLNTL